MIIAYSLSLHFQHGEQAKRGIENTNNNDMENKWNANRCSTVEPSLNNNQCTDNDSEWQGSDMIGSTLWQYYKGMDKEEYRWLKERLWLCNV